MRIWLRLKISTFLLNDITLSWRFSAYILSVSVHSQPDTAVTLLALIALVTIFATMDNDDMKLPAAASTEGDDMDLNGAALNDSINDVLGKVSVNKHDFSQRFFFFIERPEHGSEHRPIPDTDMFARPAFPGHEFPAQEPGLHIVLPNAVSRDVNNERNNAAERAVQVRLVSSSHQGHFDWHDPH